MVSHWSQSLEPDTGASHWSQTLEPVTGARHWSQSLAPVALSRVVVMTHLNSVIVMTMPLMLFVRDSITHLHDFNIGIQMTFKKFLVLLQNFSRENYFLERKLFGITSYIHSLY